MMMSGREEVFNISGGIVDSGLSSPLQFSRSADMIASQDRWFMKVNY